jgi:FkbM family methyltransferase
MCFPLNDYYLARSFILYGEYSPRETRFLRSMLRPGDVALDIGANIGAITVAMAKAVGASGKIHAYEPQSLMFSYLVSNVLLNDLRNVETVRAVVGETAGEETFNIPDSVNGDELLNYGAVSTVEPRFGAGASETVPRIRLDDLGVERVRLIKIDVEGAELAVLQGAASLLERCSPIVYFENNIRHRSRELLSFFMSRSYKLYWHMAPMYSEHNYRSEKRNVFANTASPNVLAVPSGTTFVSADRQITDPDDWWQSDSVAGSDAATQERT